MHVSYWFYTKHWLDDETRSIKVKKNSRHIYTLEEDTECYKFLLFFLPKFTSMISVLAPEKEI